MSGTFVVECMVCIVCTYGASSCFLRYPNIPAYLEAKFAAQCFVLDGPTFDARKRKKKLYFPFHATICKTSPFTRGVSEVPVSFIFSDLLFYYYYFFNFEIKGNRVE